RSSGRFGQQNIADRLSRFVLSLNILRSRTKRRQPFIREAKTSRELTQRPPERRFWYLKTPEGTVYVPAAWDQLRRWVEQGRVTADCQLAAGEARDWQPADALFAELTPIPAIPIPIAEPIAGAMITAEA